MRDSSLPQECRSDVGGIGLVVLDFRVHHLRGAVGDAWRNGVEHIGKLWPGGKRPCSNDRRYVIRRPKMPVVAQNDEIVGRDRPVGAKRAGDLGGALKQRAILQRDVVGANLAELKTAIKALEPGKPI